MRQTLAGQPFVCIRAETPVCCGTYPTPAAGGRDLVRIHVRSGSFLSLPEWAKSYGFKLGQDLAH